MTTALHPEPARARRLVRVEPGEQRCRGLGRAQHEEPGEGAEPGEVAVEQGAALVLDRRQLVAVRRHRGEPGSRARVRWRAGNGNRSAGRRMPMSVSSRAIRSSAKAADRVSPSHAGRSTEPGDDGEGVQRRRLVPDARGEGGREGAQDHRVVARRQRIHRQPHRGDAPRRMRSRKRPKYSRE
jgi:hypothetical protein